MNGSLIRLFPPAASDYARQVDAIFFSLCGVALAFIGLIACCILYFGIRYRRSVRRSPPAPVPTWLALELVWTLIPLGITLASFAWGAKLYLQSYSLGPKDAYEIAVVGKQWMWKFEHPDGRRELNELHVPLGRPVRLILISQDVIHDLFIPALRIKHDVLPVRYTSFWFQATRAGRYHLFCAQYCGTEHSQMTGTVEVLAPSEFERWLAQARGMGSPASQGRALLEVLGCRACHRTDGMATAPILEGLYGSQAILSDGTLAAVDSDYVRRHILQPGVQVVAHYQPVMPSFQGRVTEEEILQIIAYLKSTPAKEARLTP
jgi:cytochrome c oxidase subunit 2